MRLDVVIIGDTQDAWAAADEAANRGCHVAVLRPDFDGQGTETGVAAVTAAFNDSMPQAAASRQATPRELWQAAIRCHERHISEFCHRFSVESSQGQVRITSPTTVEVSWNGTTQKFEAALLLLAVGSCAQRPSALPFDQQSILVPEDVRNLSSAPSRLIVLGGNRTARAFSRLFMQAGSEVVTIDGPLRDQETTKFNASYRGDVVELRCSDQEVMVRLSTQEEVSADSLLFATDRLGATSSLGLQAAGLETDEDGRLWCDSSGYTWIPSIVAAGDVVGFPKGLREQRNSARRLIALHLDGPDSTRSLMSRFQPKRKQEQPFTAKTSPLKIFNGTP